MSGNSRYNGRTHLDFAEEFPLLTISKLVQITALKFMHTAIHQPPLGSVFPLAVWYTWQRRHA